MQFFDVADTVLPLFSRALRTVLDLAVEARPSITEVRLTGLAITRSSDADEEQYLCSAEVAGESRVTSFVFLPDLERPHRLYRHFLSDIEDWVAESGFGWGLNIEASAQVDVG